MSKPTDPMDPPDPTDVPDPSAAPYIPRLVDPAPYDPDTPRPARAAEAPPVDHVAMARELAAQAKARVAAAAPKEDPVTLAKRLAAEAKKKAAANAPKEDPVALAKRLAAEAKKKAGPAKKKKPAPVAPAPAGNDLMSRMAQPRKKARSAADILAEARLAEAETPIVAPTKQAPPPPPAQRPSTPAGPNPAKAVLAILRNATLREVKPVSAGPAFKAVWNAHLARAQATEDTALAVSAAAILAAVERVGAEGLSAAEVRWGGQSHAVFVESHSGTIIATAYPSGVYLAGI